MKLVRIEDKLQEEKPQGVALLAFGFRPFFLLGSIAGVVLTVLWVHGFSSGAPRGSYFGFLQWHSHEMIFGFVAAILAGFLLTAAGTWTNQPMPRGASLAVLTGLWMLGRLLPFAYPAVPGWVVMGVDVAFLPSVAVCLARPLLKIRQRRNYVFVPLLLVMAAGNLLMHLPVLGASVRLSPVGRDLGLYMILVAVVIVGGRVIPFFTGRALAGTEPRMRKPVEMLAYASVLLVAVAEVARLPASVRMIAGLLAFVVHLARWWGWQSWGVWRTPLLWILHIAYAWLILGFALTAIAAQGALPPTLPQHAFTVGGFSVMILGMISRVSLGHTGRPLKPNPAVVLAFYLINAAAVVRVLFPIPAMDRYLLWINLSGILWALAFALFAVVYTPILTRPRPDGKTG